MYEISMGFMVSHGDYYMGWMVIEIDWPSLIMITVMGLYMGLINHQFIVINRE